MSLKERVKTYNFWVSLASAIFLIINIIGQKFNFYVDEGIFNDLFTALCAILVLLGIIVPPKNKTNISTQNLFSEENLPELNTPLKQIQIIPEVNQDDLEVNEMEETVSDEEQNGSPYENKLEDENSNENISVENEHDNENSCEGDSVENESQTVCQEKLESFEQTEQSLTIEPTTEENTVSETREENQNAVNTENDVNVTFISLLNQQLDGFSGSKEELKHILYSEIERLGE